MIEAKECAKRNAYLLLFERIRVVVLLVLKRTSNLSSTISMQFAEGVGGFSRPLGIAVN